MADEHGTPRHVRQPCVSRRAAKQWGNVTTAQLRECGVTARTAQRWLGEGRLVRILRGVYSVGHRSPAPEAFWAAVLLGDGEDAVLTRHTALALHGLGPAPRVATVATPKQARSRHRVTVHSSMPFKRDEVVSRRGLRATSIERTLLD